MIVIFDFLQNLNLTASNLNSPASIFKYIAGIVKLALT